MTPLLTLLLGIAFLHGIFTSGFIPILNRVLAGQSGLAFGLFFVGLVVGQLLIWRFEALSKHPLAFTAYEFFFALSLIYMGLFPATWALISGRGLEGLAAGLATPLLFARMVAAPTQMGLEKKIVRYNGTFALGFVLGPQIIALGMQYWNYQTALIVFGLGFIAVNLAAIPLLPEIQKAEPESLTLAYLFAGSSWFEKFASLFYGKVFYGFLLTFITSYAAQYFAKVPVANLILLLAFLFVVGNQLGAKTLKYFNKRHLEIALPLIIATLLLGFMFTSQGWLLFVAALFHAYLLFIAFMNFSTQMKSGREFALFNSLADPGMVLGATAALVGLNGIWILVILAIIPALYWKTAKQKTTPNPVP